MTSDTQRTVWHLTAAWLSGCELQRAVVGVIANKVAQNDKGGVGFWLPRALYPRARRQ